MDAVVWPLGNSPRRHCRVDSWQESSVTGATDVHAVPSECFLAKGLQELVRLMTRTQQARQTSRAVARYWSMVAFAQVVPGGTRASTTPGGAT
ncbi:hypothetical protein GCM10011492_25210 [Flexivirga endophytica]|uniref:Uncharacterized protein n=1 Tax=Flexivirga endophytica TaxID=1849103 RepID=A0A916T848_9MICO|nr:hypothetical protein GCM10011492_25210 [Flexivirga endophytica]GHB41553.1 hypothetical protein GCM10008112_07600 [Flexivirga endophytica]